MLCCDTLVAPGGLACVCDAPVRPPVCVCVLFFQCLECGEKGPEMESHNRAVKKPGGVSKCQLSSCGRYYHKVSALVQQQAAYLCDVDMPCRHADQTQVVCSLGVCVGGGGLLLLLLLLSP